MINPRLPPFARPALAQVMLALSALASIDAQASQPAGKQVVMLDVPPFSYSVMEPMQKGFAAFGALGGIAVAARQKTLNSRLNESFDKQGLQFGTQLDSAMRKLLRSDGIQVVGLSESSSVSPDTPTLSVRVSAGYASTNGTRDYMPFALVFMRLVSGDGSRELHRAVLSYCENPTKVAATVRVPCPDSVKPLASDEELFSDEAQLARSIEAAIEPSAAALARELAAVLR